MTRMYNPPHPGEVLRDGVFTGTGITVTSFAKRIGVTRVTLSNLLNGKNGVSADMAVRLARFFGTSPEFWMNLQSAYELARVRSTLRRKIEKIQPHRSAA